MEFFSNTLAGTFNNKEKLDAQLDLLFTIYRKETKAGGDVISISPHPAAAAAAATAATTAATTTAKTTATKKTTKTTTKTRKGYTNPFEWRHTIY